MVRMTGMVVLVVALVTAPLATADYGAGERALEAGQPTEALGHWREAAEAGDERAMFALARLYRQGLGVLQDYVEAHKWFNIAASRGEAKAAAERDALAAKMTPQQVAAAQERAAGWQRDTHRVSGAPETASRSNETSATVVRAGPPPPPRAVREAQSLLRALGYRPGPADGIWGARTGKAHRAFLRDAGLPTAEMLTPEALRALRAIAKRQGGGTEAKHSAVTARASTGVNAPGVTTEPSDALHSAAQAGDIDRLKAVLDVGVDVNARDERGWTAMMYAVDKRYPLLVESLLEAKADPNVRAPDGATPLFMAAAHGHSEIIQQLMQGGADITIRGPNGKTAVDVARTRYGDVETAQQRTEPEAVLTLLRGKSLAEAGHRSLEKASREADEMAFAEAKSKGTAEAYRVYMSTYPNGRHLNEARHLHTIARKTEERLNLSKKIANKNFSGPRENGDHITYRFLSTGKVIGTYDPGWFFGLPTTSSCFGEWYIEDGKVQFNCDYGIGGINLNCTGQMEGNTFVVREKSWLGVEVLRLTH